MSFLPKPPLYSGIEINKKELRVANMLKTRKGWELVSLKTYNENDPVNQLDIGTTVSALSSREILVRSLELPVKKTKDFKAAVSFRLEPLLPYKLDRASVQTELTEKKSNTSVLTAFVCRNDHIQKHLDVLQKRELVSEKITCVPYALAALVSLFHNATQIQFLVHEGVDEITCILTQNSKLLTSRAFEKSGDWALEVQKTILSFLSTHKTKSFDNILFIGNRRDEIEKATGKKVLSPLFSKISISHDDLTNYGLAIGIAVAANGINFRETKFSCLDLWNRYRKPLSTSVALIALLFCAFFLYEMFSISKIKKEAGRAFFSVIKETGRSISYKSLPKTSEDYLGYMYKIEKEINSQPNIFPLKPQLPLVKDCLAWLSSQPGVVIDSFHYKLVKFPTVREKQEHYKALITIDFHSQNSKSAQDFRDVVTSRNVFIDSGEEISWSSNRASFYLKDKTSYET